MYSNSRHSLQEFLIIALVLLTTEPNIAISEDESMTSLVTLKKSRAAHFSASFSPNSKRLAFIDWHGTVFLWDVTTGKQVDVFRSEPKAKDVMPYGVVAFSSDGKTIVSAFQQRVILWDCKTGEQQGQFQVRENQVTSLAISSDSKHLAAGTDEGKVSVWNLPKMTLRATLDGYEEGVYSMAFAPDAKTLAIPAAREGAIAFWDLATFQRKSQIVADEDALATIFYSQNGEALVCSNGTKTRILDRASGKQKKQLDIPVYSPYAVAFSSKESLLAVGGGSIENINNDIKQTFHVKLINLNTGQRLKRIVHHDQAITSIAFSLDRKKIATTSFDGSVKLLGLSKEDKLAK